MRVYMANFYSAHSATTPNARISRASNPTYVLESFHYMDDGRAAYIKKNGKTIFLDSGAFSMFTQGIKVDLKKYAAYLTKHAGIIHVASSLDVIGRDAELASYNNFVELKKMVDPAYPIHPVHHARDADKWLERYLDEGHEYIFLGGMVPESKPYLIEWLDHIWSKFLVDKNGQPKVKVHGFGLTILDLMFRYPWFSVDSTSWVLKSRYGLIFLDIPHMRRHHVSIDISNQSPRQREINSWHYKSLRPDERMEVDERLRSLDFHRNRDLELETHLEKMTGIKQGYYPETLAQMYGWRDHINIDFFNRLCSDEMTTFVPEQERLFT